MTDDKNILIYLSTTNSRNLEGWLSLQTPAQESVTCKFLQGQDKKRPQAMGEAPTIEG